MARPKSINKHKFDEDLENAVSRVVVDNEYNISKNAKVSDDLDFESVIDLLECKHTEKNYEWMSDICFPELASIIITDASSWANQYFQTRNFVEAKLEGFDPKDKLKCEAAKRCINQTLNNRAIFHYYKYIRGRTINATSGQVYAVCWWEQETIPQIIGYTRETEELDVDINGNPMTDGNLQEPAYRTAETPQYGEKIKVDRFNYEIVDPRNIFIDNKYCYSPQEKDWIIIRTEKSYEQLKGLEAKNGYFNLNIVKELKPPRETETKKDTYGQLEEERAGDKTPVRYFDVLLRFGKMWCKVKERDPDNNPTIVTPGFDRSGEILNDAELLETIIEEVICGNQRVLIRFQPTPFRDSLGNTYKPICRGLCYIHPTKDTGLSDGKFLRELNIGINDTLNMSNDRVKLATLPTLQGAKYALEDNSTLYFEPQHIMEVENPGKDLVEFKISDNIQGALAQTQIFQSEGQKISAVFPTTMGDLPGRASTTATAVAGAESRGNLRGNYKSLTYEYTFLLDFYWMILQMTYQFARPETAVKMMGESSEDFDPSAEYSYTPISSNIEMEYNKYKKLQTIDQFVGRIVNIPNPNTPKLLNYLLAKAFSLFGDEFPDYKNYLLDESKEAGEVMMMGGKGPTPSDMGNIPTSNQSGQPQLPAEEFARGGGG